MATRRAGDAHRSGHGPVLRPAHRREPGTWELAIRAETVPGGPPGVPLRKMYPLVLEPGKDVAIGARAPGGFGDGSRRSRRLGRGHRSRSSGWFFAQAAPPAGPRAARRSGSGMRSRGICFTVLAVSWPPSPSRAHSARRRRRRRPGCTGPGRAVGQGGPDAAVDPGPGLGHGRRRHQAAVGRSPGLRRRPQQPRRRGGAVHPRTPRGQRSQCPGHPPGFRHRAVRRVVDHHRRRQDRPARRERPHRARPGQRGDGRRRPGGRRRDDGRRGR